jgi:hypothetical protein
MPIVFQAYNSKNHIFSPGQAQGEKNTGDWQEPPMIAGGRKRIAPPERHSTKYGVYNVCDPSLFRLESFEKGMTVKKFAKAMANTYESEELCPVYSASNGGFFNVHKNGRMSPTGELVVRKKQLYISVVEVALGLDILRQGRIAKSAEKHLQHYMSFAIIDGKASIMPAEDFYYKYTANPAEFNATTREYSGVQYKFDCYPNLVQDGELCGNEYLKKRTKARRSAVGILPDGRYLEYCSPDAITFKELAKRMKSFGCVKAMGRDGGGSVQTYAPGNPNDAIEPGGEDVNTGNAIIKSNRNVQNITWIAKPGGD